jgi:hypothetical protein
MSGLLELIARRRRASASSRLGPPPSSNGTTHTDELVEPPAASRGDTNGRGQVATHGRSTNGKGPEHPVIEEAVAEVEPEAEVPQADAIAPEAEAESMAVEPEVPQTDAEGASDQTAESSSQPHNPDDFDQPQLGFLERGRIRRRARYLRQLREVQMRDIGGFLLELHRFGRERPDLVNEKVAGAADTDLELRALERLLGEQRRVGELREPGLGGACPGCGAVHGSADRYCASCGEPLTAATSAPGDSPS